MNFFAYLKPPASNVDMKTVTQEIDQIIVESITNQPRSLQKRIGPSEIGEECTHCLAAKLAGWEKQEHGVGWASTIGTGGHLLMEEFFNRHEENNLHRRFLTEVKVKVGTLGNQEIWGSTDLLDVVNQCTGDWKFVGKSSLEKYRRHGPSQKYRVQAHLYAHGWNKAGIPVKYVSICFLPRASNNWNEHFWWYEEYDPSVAETALQRLNDLYQQVITLEAVMGVEARDQWISSLPREPGCWDCRKYADYKPTPTMVGGITIDL